MHGRREGNFFFYENLRKHFGSHIYSVQTSQDYRNRHPEENKKLCAFIITKNENKRNRKGAGLVLHHTLPKGLAASIWGQRLGCGMSFLFFFSVSPFGDFSFIVRQERNLTQRQNVTSLCNNGQVTLELLLTSPTVNQCPRHHTTNAN